MGFPPGSESTKDARLLDPVERRRAFWERQYGPERTKKQVAFDVAFGIVLPLLCLVLDPFLFRGGFGTGLLAPLRALTYVAIALEIALLSMWLQQGRAAGLLAGALYCGAALALLIGLVCLPLSVLGLLSLVSAPSAIGMISVLGFVPIATAFVFRRNAVRAWRRLKANGPSGIRIRAAAGFLIALAIPVGTAWYVNGQLTRALHLALDVESSAKGVSALRKLGMFFDANQLLSLHRAERDPDRRAHIERIYFEITGETVEEGLARLD
jgi:hypothetical protein